MPPPRTVSVANATVSDSSTRSHPAIFCFVSDPNLAVQESGQAGGDVAGLHSLLREQTARLDGQARQLGIGVDHTAAGAAPYGWENGGSEGAGASGSGAVQPPFFQRGPPAPAAAPRVPLIPTGGGGAASSRDAIYEQKRREFLRRQQAAAGPPMPGGHAAAGPPMPGGLAARATGSVHAGSGAGVGGWCGGQTGGDCSGSHAAVLAAGSQQDPARLPVSQDAPAMARTLQPPPTREQEPPRPALEAGLFGADGEAVRGGRAQQQQEYAAALQRQQLEKESERALERSRTQDDGASLDLGASPSSPELRKRQQQEYAAALQRQQQLAEKQREMALEQARGQGVGLGIVGEPPPPEKRRRQQQEYAAALQQQQQRQVEREQEYALDQARGHGGGLGIVSPPSPELRKRQQQEYAAALQKQQEQQAERERELALEHARGQGGGLGIVGGAPSPERRRQQQQEYAAALQQQQAERQGEQARERLETAGLDDGFGRNSTDGERRRQQQEYAAALQQQQAEKGRGSARRQEGDSGGALGIGRIHPPPYQPSPTSKHSLRHGSYERVAVAVGGEASSPERRRRHQQEYAAALRQQKEEKEREQERVRERELGAGFGIGGHTPSDEERRRQQASSWRRGMAPRSGNATSAAHLCRRAMQPSLRPRWSGAQRVAAARSSGAEVAAAEPLERRARTCSAASVGAATRLRGGGASKRLCFPERSTTARSAVLSQRNWTLGGLRGRAAVSGRGGARAPVRRAGRDRGGGACR